MNKVWPVGDMNRSRQLPDSSGFDRATWMALCEALAEDAVRSCGLSYELYVTQFSDAVDEKLQGIDPQDRYQAIDLAERWGYTDPQRREALLKEQMKRGFGSHDLDPGAPSRGCRD